LRGRLGELDRNKLIIIYCAVGLRAYIATRILVQNGFKNVKNLSGGFTTYSCVFCQENNKPCGGIDCSFETTFSDSGDVEDIAK